MPVLAYFAAISVKRIKKRFIALTPERRTHNDLPRWKGLALAPPVKAAHD